MYETPSPDELRQYMIAKKMTAADIAALTGVESRAARRWVAPADQKGARPIPWAAWALIQLFTGEKSKEDFLKLLDEWKKEKTSWGLFQRGQAGRPLKGADDE